LVNIDQYCQFPGAEHAIGRIPNMTNSGCRTPSADSPILVNIDQYWQIVRVRSAEPACPRESWIISFGSEGSKRGRVCTALAQHSALE
jgi:hypothetical protein